MKVALATPPIPKSLKENKATGLLAKRFKNHLYNKVKRKPGILEGKATVTFKDDFKMSEEDLIE